MHEAGWSTDARAGSEQDFLVADEKRKLTLEHVERIGVAPMEVGVGTVTCVGEQRFRDGQLLEVRLDPNGAAFSRCDFLTVGLPKDDRVHDAPV
jgi:hypothetical protein